MESTFFSSPFSKPDLADATRQVDILQRVIVSISSGSTLEPLLSKILDGAIVLTRATHGTIGLVIDLADGPVIRTVATYNMPDGELGAEMASGVGLAGCVLKEDRTIRLDRYGDLDYPTLPELAEHSVLGVPIRWGEKMIGFFGIGAAVSHHFNEWDAETLEFFGKYAAIAIHNANLFETSEQALGELRLLYATSQRISLAGNVDEVISAYLDQVAEHGRYICNVCLYEFDAQDQRVAVIIRGRWNPEEGSQQLEERIPYSHDDLDALLDAGQTVTISDVRTDSRVTTHLREMQEESGRPALAMCPLMVRGRRIGVVVLSYPGIHNWTEVSLWPYQATAAQLATAIDSRMQQGLLYERVQQLAVLQERQRLARELHDSVTQLIFSTTLIAQSISPAWKRDPLEGQLRVDRLLELSQTALREMRSLLFELNVGEDKKIDSISPLTGLERINRHGLLGALHLLAEDFSSENIHVHIESQNYPPTIYIHSESTEGFRLKPAIEEGVYRITQEALNNAIKHARAHQVVIHLDGSKLNKLCFSIKDDGIGFMPGTDNLKGKSEDGGFGMNTMRERTEKLGGQIHIISAPGKGTTVEVTIPFEDAGI
ncbi:MAG: GAF domain-containing sensor histidine kinase [Anaerolineales bacterium]|nr:GAF domain-containing sensor histidine kinase [Anaerolineales bacterium]